MKRRSRRLTTASLAIAACLAAAPPASAQTAAENKAAARTLAVEGFKLADAGQCPEAIEKLQRAEQLYHAPSILGRLGECQVVVGRIVEGTENLNRVLRERLDASSPEAFRQAQARAREVLATALPKIAKLRIDVEAPEGAQYQVTVSGKPVPPALFGAERPTDPGTHDVVASGEGLRAVTESVTLAEGGSESITITLEPDPNAAAPGDQAAGIEPGAGTQPAETAPSAEGASKVPGIAVLAGGGAFLAIGAITGGLALGKKNDLDGSCPQKQCPPDVHGDVDSAKTLGLISTIGFAVGAAGIGVGTFLLVRAGGSSEPAKDASAERGVVARPWIGLGAAGVSGTF